MNKIILFADLVNNSEPSPDIAECSDCGWRGDVSECDTGQDGDWESGYFEIHLCPMCKDGGCIDYDMSETIAIAWHEWNKQRKKR